MLYLGRLYLYISESGGSVETWEARLSEKSMHHQGILPSTMVALGMLLVDPNGSRC